MSTENLPTENLPTENRAETTEKIITILVVDDTTTNLQVLFDLLQVQGYRVATANNGEAALERLESFLPDLILLDVMMPGINGFETCCRIKNNSRTEDIPIIFMTALSDPMDKVKGLGMGAVDYVTKPFQHEEVIVRIQVHLQLRYLNQSLALRVAERDQSLKALRRTQMKLIQNEKMASLGQMVAGIAHEINNPVNFVHGNVAHTSEYCEDLLNLIKLYQQEYPHPTPAIQQSTKELDLEFVREDLHKLMDSMNTGTERIRNIVLALRNFSRLDESERKLVDIHEGINSTLFILQHRLTNKSEMPDINVIRDFNTLPQVECYPSQLNQVIMHLLTNAIDALEESNLSNPNIRIRTLVVHKTWIQVAIADNGPGIPDTVKANLFDPFFTTKAVGKGTGLGLSISHQIITEKHSGKIDCHSIVGQGAEFIVQIPIQQLKDQA